jgi:hypothetical protein
MRSTKSKGTIMKLSSALLGGAVGAVTLTVLHEGLRHLLPHAPRVDVLGMRLVAATARATGATPPPRDQRYWLALGGDLLANTLFYSLVGVGGAQGATMRGGLLGLAGGVGAVALPRVLGLGPQPGARFPLTQLLPVAWYSLGGVAAGASYGASSADSATRDEPTARPRRPPDWAYKLINPVMMSLLRSPLHGLLGSRLLVLEFRGRRSGKTYRLPVGYVQRSNELLITTQRPWAKNFAGGVPVRVWLRGQAVPGTADVTADVGQLQEAYTQMLAAAPQLAPLIGVHLDATGRPIATEVAAAQERGFVVVRVVLAEAAS